MMDQPQVFAVDDDASVLASVRAVLAQARYDVICFASAEQFLAEAPLDVPGCLVTDLQMPGVGGVELQRRLLEAGSPLSLVIVTGVADVPTAVTLMERGAVTLLEKPYNHAALLKAVERALTDSVQRYRRRQAERAAAVRLAQLTRTERNVMEYVLSGAPNKAISEALDLSMRTVDRRRQTILHKMGVQSVPELAILLGGIENWRKLATPKAGSADDVSCEP
jgi:FixJ family two-component response regulator